MEFKLKKTDSLGWIILACVVVVLFSTLSIWLWAPSRFVKPGVAGAGEAFEAYHAAMNVNMFGWHWAGLQDMATNPEPKSHPYLYIHHGNLGLYVSYLFGWLGLASLEAQNFASLMASVLGLFAYFYSVRLKTRNGAIAAVGLMLLALNWAYLDVWAFNVHRAFSYFSVMGTIYAYWRVERGDFKSAGWFTAFVVGCLTLLLADYIFYFFTLILLALGVLAALPRTGLKLAVRSIIVLGLGFGIVFCLRQIQVIVGAGIDVWKHDFLYQVLNRIHMESLFQGNWPKDTTEFYASNSILNPGFAPPAPWSLRLHGFFEGTGQIFLTYILGLKVKLGPAALLVGAGFMCLFFITVVTDLFVRWFSRFNELRRAISTGSAIALILGMAAVTIFDWRATSILLGSLLVLCSLTGAFCIMRGPAQQLMVAASGSRDFIVFGTLFFLSCLCMYALFPRYFLQWYPEFLLAPLCVVIWTVALIAPMLSGSSTLRSPTTAILVAIFSLKVVSFIPSLLKSPTNEGQHAAILHSLAGQPTASNFTPASVSSYTNAFSGWLKPEAVEKMLSTGIVSPDDYSMIFEVDRNNPLYTKPRYFVLFKGYDTSNQLAAIKERRAPIIENSTVAVFEAPEN